jgi:hypothetical protein
VDGDPGGRYVDDMVTAGNPGSRACKLHAAGTVRGKLERDIYSCSQKHACINEINS